MPGRRWRPQLWADRFISAIEWIAAGFVGLVAADIFVSVLLRAFFNVLDPGRL